MITSLETVNPLEMWTLARYSYYVFMSEKYMHDAMDAETQERAKLCDDCANNYLDMCDNLIKNIDTHVCIQIISEAMRTARECRAHRSFMSASNMYTDCIRMAWNLYKQTLA